MVRIVVKLRFNVVLLQSFFHENNNLQCKLFVFMKSLEILMISMSFRFRNNL